MLEEKLRKRQAELSRLEYLESKEKVVKTPTFQHADSIDGELLVLNLIFHETCYALRYN